MADTPHIPDVLLTPSIDIHDAARALAEGGHKIAPITTEWDGHKNPGVLLGKKWQTKTTTDPDILREWFTPPKTRSVTLGDAMDNPPQMYRTAPFETLGIAVHAGPNVVIFDVDNAEYVPDELWPELERAPFQSSSSTDTRRGHYYFRTKAGRYFGQTASVKNVNGESCGELRHGNAVAISAPSKHQKSHLGRRYQWIRAGVIPEMSDDLATFLESKKRKDDWQGHTVEVTEASFDDINTLREEHTTATNPDIVVEHVDYMRRRAATQGLHNAFRSPLINLLEMASHGYIAAADAIDAAGDAFVEMRTDPNRGGNVRDQDAARNEFVDLLTWALGKVKAKAAVDPGAVAAETADHVRQHYDADIESPAGGAPLTAVDALNAAEEEEIRNNATLTRYPAVDIAALMASPPEPPNWLEEGVIAEGVYYGLTAAAKAGKSILTYWMAGHWALGRSALDHTRTFDPKTVLYLDFENGPYWLHTQLSKMGFPSTIGDKLKVVQFPALGALNTPKGAEELHRLVDAYKPDVIVIDTISRTVVGDENSSSMWLDFYRYAITPIRQARPDVTIIRLDHTGKDEARGARGSSAKMSDLETHWVLTSDERDRNALTLTLERARMSFHADRVHLRRTDSPLGHAPRASKSGGGAIDWGAMLAVNDDVEAVNADLDAFGADNTISNARAKALLKDHGKPVNSELVAAALRQRKERDNTPAEETPKALE